MRKRHWRARSKVVAPPFPHCLTCLHTSQITDHLQSTSRCSHTPKWRHKVLVTVFDENKRERCF
jgi:hypothetical protein